MLDHLTDNCNGLDNTDAIKIRLSIQLRWGESPVVPEFILWMKKGQNKSACANLPIKDAYIAAIATRLIRANQYFPANYGGTNCLSPNARGRHGRRRSWPCTKQPRGLRSQTKIAVSPWAAQTPPHNRTNNSLWPISFLISRHTWKVLTQRRQLTIPRWKSLWLAVRVSAPPLRSNMPQLSPFGRRTTLSGIGASQGGRRRQHQ